MLTALYGHMRYKKVMKMVSYVRRFTTSILHLTHLRTGYAVFVNCREQVYSVCRRNVMLLTTSHAHTSHLKSKCVKPAHTVKLALQNKQKTNLGIP